MALQYSLTHRTNAMSDIITQAGSTSYILIYTGTVPTSAATAATGTLLASLPCSATFGTAANGVLTAGAITNATATATGTAGYWRLATTSAGTSVVAQGNVYQSTPLVTSAASTASNTLTFTGTTGVVVGMNVNGTGIPAATYVLAVTATTVTLNNNATVASGATITFGGDISFNATSFTTGQTVTVTSFTITATGA